MNYNKAAEKLIQNLVQETLLKIKNQPQTEELEEEQIMEQKPTQLSRQISSPTSQASSFTNLKSTIQSAELLFAKHEDLLTENNIQLEVLKHIPVEEQYELIEELAYKKKFNKNKVLLDAYQQDN